MPELPPPQEIEQELLDYDQLNPRLVETVQDEQEPDEILETLWRAMSAEEIALSIAAHGFFRTEPIFATRNNGRYTVIEGNRRLAAVRVILNRELQEKFHTDLPHISAAVKQGLKTLPVVVVNDRDDIWPLVGFKHVNGPRAWGAWAKANYIARVHEENGVELREISQLIGDTHATVRRLYRGFAVLNWTAPGSGVLAYASCDGV